MFNPRMFENSQPDGFAVLEVVRELGSESPGLLPPLEPKAPGEQARLFVPLTRTELAGEVVGPVAALRLTQTFGYSRQQCPPAGQSGAR